MSWAVKSPVINLGTAEATGVGVALVTLTTGYASGDVVVVWAATKATGATGESTVVNITDSKGNSYIRAKEYSYASTTTGARGSLHYSVLTTPLVSGDTITVGFSGAAASGYSQFRDAAVRGFTHDVAFPVVSLVAATGNIGTGGAISGSLAGLPAGQEYLYLATVANRNSGVIPTISGDTTNGWALGAGYQTGTSGGTSASGLTVHWNHRIATATGATYNVSGLVAAPSAIVLAALREKALPMPPATNFEITSGSLSFGTPVFSQNHNFQSPTSLEVGSPVLGVADLSITIDATGLTVGSPAIDAPALGQVLLATSLDVGSPDLGAPELTVNQPVFSVAAQSSDSPVLDNEPAFAAWTELAATGLVTSVALTNVPAFGLAAGNEKTLEAVNLEVGSPVLDAPALVQDHVLAAVNLEVRPNTLVINDAHEASVNFGCVLYNVMVGQPFVATTPTLDEVDVWLHKGGSPTDSVICLLYEADTNGYPDSLVTTSSNAVLGTDLTTTSQKKTFNFSPVSLTQDANYVFVLLRSGTLSDDDWYLAGRGQKSGSTYVFKENVWYVQSNQALTSVIRTHDVAPSFSLNAPGEVTLEAVGLEVGSPTLAGINYRDRTDAGGYYYVQQATVEDGVADPYGGNTAKRMAEDSTDDYHSLYYNNTTLGAPPTDQTFSFWIDAKADGRDWIYFWCGNLVGGSRDQTVNLSAGTFGDAHDGIAFNEREITSLGNGWWRIRLTGARGDLALTAQLQVENADSNYSYQGLGSAYGVIFGKFLVAPGTVYPSLAELRQTHVLEATNLEVGSPVLDAPALAQCHALTATGIATRRPRLGVPPSEVWSTDFETGDLSDVKTVGGTPQAQSGVVHSGSYAAMCDRNEEFDTPDGAINTDTFYVKFFLRLSESWDSITFFGLNCGSVTQNPVYFDIRNGVSGHNRAIRLMKYMDGVSSTLGETAEDVLSFTEWNLIELKCVIGAPGSVELKVNGNIEFSIDYTNNTRGNITAAWFGQFYNDWPLYYDDIAISYTAYPGASTPTLSLNAPNEVSLEAANLEVGSPVLDAPALVQSHVFEATNLEVGSPALDAPAFGQTHALAAVNLEVRPNTLVINDARVASQAFGAAVWNMYAGQPFVATIPTLDSADFWLHQQGDPTDAAVCKLYTADGDGFPVTLVATSTNTIPGSELTNSPQLKTFNFDYVALTPDANYVLVLTRTGALTDFLYYRVWRGWKSGGTYVYCDEGIWYVQTELTLTSALRTHDVAPSFSLNELGEVTLEAVGLTVASPVLDAPALTQHHTLTAAELTVGSPVLGTPSLNLGGVVNFSGYSLTIYPSLGSPALNRVALVATGLTVGSPELGTPVFASPLMLSAGNWLADAPVLDNVPAFQAADADVVMFTATALTVGSPVLDAPAFGQHHVLVANELVVASPVLGTPDLVTIFLTAVNLDLASPSLVNIPAFTAHYWQAVGLTVGSPVLGTPALNQHVTFSTDGITISPVLGTPALTPAGAGEFVAQSLEVGSPVLGSPALVQHHVLEAVGLTVASPVLDATTLMIGTVMMEPLSLAVGSPVLGAPAFTQAHVLAATGLTVGAYVLGSPTFGQNYHFTATGLTVQPYVLDAASYGRVVTAVGLTVGSPALATPALVQHHVLEATGLTVGSPQFSPVYYSEAAFLPAEGFSVGSPVLGTPALTQKHVLHAANLTVGSPSLGAPQLVKPLTAAPLTVGSPVLGVATYVSTAILTAANLEVGSPVLGTPVLTPGYRLTATPLAVSSPVLGSSSLVKVLAAANLTVGSPVLPTPEYKRSFLLEAVGLAVGSPAIDLAAMGQNHHLVAANFATASPVLSPAQIAQHHVLAAFDLVVHALGLPQIRLIQGYPFEAVGLTVGSPVFENPYLELVVYHEQAILTGSPGSVVSIIGSPRAPPTVTGQLN